MGRRMRKGQNCLSLWSGWQREPTKDKNEHEGAVEGLSVPGNVDSGEDSLH